MALVELRPGDTLNIVWSSVQDTPLGVREVESSFAFSYDELLSRLRTKGKVAKSRRSGTDGARFSRVVALTISALKKGKWSTGAEISRSEVFRKMTKRFADLNPAEYMHITENAKEALVALYDNESVIKKNQKVELAEILRALQLPVQD